MYSVWRVNRHDLVSYSLFLFLFIAANARTYGDVAGHEVSWLGELVATDLEHGAGPSRVALQREWTRSPSGESQFGSGWVDLNVIRLEPIGPDGVMVFRGGRPWKFGRGDGDTFHTGGNHTIRRTPDGWKMSHPTEGSWTFGPTGALISFQDPFGQRTELIYDKKDRLLAVEHDAQNFLRYHYDAVNNRITRIDGPEGLSASYEYDNTGRLIAATTGWSVRTQYDYADNGDLLRATDQFGGRLEVSETTAVEPSDDAVIAEVARRRAAQVGGITTASGPAYETDERGLVTRISDSGRVATLTYDHAGRLASIESDQKRQSYTYDVHGRVIAVTENDGLVTRIAYNRLDLPAEIVTSDGASMTLDYNAHGMLLKALQSSGEQQEWEYDDRGRVIRRRRVPGIEEKYLYDEHGRLVGVTQSDGNQTRYTYDDRGNLLREERGSGEAWRYTYDDAGRMIEQTIPSGLTTQFAYNKGSRLLWQQNPVHGRIAFDDSRYAQNVLSLVYDSQRTWSMRANDSLLPVERTDPAGRVSRYQYDNRDRLTAVTTASGRTWRYEYDDANQQATVNGPGTLRIERSYDRGGRVTRIKRGDVVWREYTYDTRGRLREVRSPSGTGAVYGYDAAARISDVTLPGGKAEFDYDQQGQLAGIRHPAFQIRNEYHANGMLARRVYDPAQLELQTPIDRFGRRAGIELNGVAVSYRYNDRGQLAAITLPDKSQIVLTTDDAGRPVRFEYSDGLTVGIAYDASDQVTSIGAVDRDMSLLFLEQYEFSAVGNLTELHRQGQPAKTFVYDADDRLTGMQTPSGETTYEYSADGDLRSVLSEAQTVHWDLDSEGRPTQGSLRTFYSWNESGNLVETDDVKSAACNEFNAAGWLTARRTTAGEWQYGYLPDGDRLRQSKRLASGELETTWYAYVTDGLVGFKDAQSVTWLVVCLPGTDWPLALCGSNGKNYAVIADRLRSIRRLVDASGKTVSAADYGPYGEVVQKTGESPLWTFAGMVCDPSGLYYARQRYYDPKLSRFISIDPLCGSYEYPESHNAYAYAVNNPCRHRDPGGTSGFEWWWNPTPKHMSNEDLVEYFRQLRERGDFYCRPEGSRFIDDNEWNRLMKKTEEVREELFKRKLAKPVSGPPIKMPVQRTKASAKAETVYNGKLPLKERTTGVVSGNTGTGSGLHESQQTSRLSGVEEPPNPTTQVIAQAAEEQTGRVSGSSPASPSGEVASSRSGASSLSGAGESAPSGANSTNRVRISQALGPETGTSAGSAQSSTGSALGEASGGTGSRMGASAGSATEGASSGQSIAGSSEGGTGSTVSRSASSFAGSSSGSRLKSIWNGLGEQLSEMPTWQKAASAAGFVFSVFAINQAANEGFNEGGRIGALKAAAWEGLKAAVSTYHPLGMAVVMTGEMNYKVLTLQKAVTEEINALNQARTVENALQTKIENAIQTAIDDPEARKNLIPLQGNPGAIDPNNPGAKSELVNSLVAAALSNFAQNRPVFQGIFTQQGQQPAAAQYTAAMQAAAAKIAQAESLLQQIRMQRQQSQSNIQTLEQTARQQLQALQAKAQRLATPRGTLRQLAEETQKLEEMTREAAQNKPKPAENEANWAKIAKEAEEVQRTVCGYAGKCQGTEKPQEEPSKPQNLGRVVELVPIPDPISNPSPFRLIAFAADETLKSDEPLEGKIKSGFGSPSSGGEGGTKESGGGCSEEEAKDLRKKASELITSVLKAIEEESKKMPTDVKSPKVEKLRIQINTVQALAESLQREIDGYSELLRGFEKAQSALQEINASRQQLSGPLRQFQTLNLVNHVEQLLAPYYASSEAIRLRILAQAKQEEANGHQNALSFMGLSNLGQLIQNAQSSKSSLQTFAQEVKRAIQSAEQAKKAAQAVIDDYEALTTAGEFAGRKRALMASAEALKCRAKIKSGQQDQAPPMQGDRIADKTVPSIIGLLAKDAKEKLGAAGFVPQFQVGTPAPEDKQPFEVYKQEPEGGTQAAQGTAVVVTIYDERQSEGFQPGDGTKVDPRFANAKLTDGNLGVLEEKSSFPINAPGAGSRCALYATDNVKVGSNWSWVVKKFATPAGARQIPSGCAKAWENASDYVSDSGKGHHKIFEKRLTQTDALLHHEILSPTYNGGDGSPVSGYYRAFVYRDVFLIMYARNVPQLGYDFSGEVQRVFDASKKLIDLRYPPNSK